MGHSMIEELLQDVMATAYGEWTPENGCTGTEIAAAEDRLGIGLPDALRAYYAVAGLHAEMMGADGHQHTLRMSAPERLVVEGGWLIFCGENQWPAQWSTHPDDDDRPDPRVHGRTGPGEKWFSESRSLSAFLINVACRQAVMSLPYQATCRLRKGQLETVESLLGYVGSREACRGGDWLSFLDRPTRTLASYSFITSTVRVGATAPDALASFQERSGLRLKAAEGRGPAARP
ncbi:SMI1/KNR4 family protein [Planomonospora sp. ID67723]|uniref:SMI1/KNR4 family protein n=1 Tax=Planomonospora sp. ID67723 TaxID=2738134 RepID=UPI0018C3AE73|nr:SMI1/KNR4 family protein [Planomonospora sp. ID67723]MBG0831823.1 SMI1/KNR4 family protein [Planomonospora sp. ID67723]